MSFWKKVAVFVGKELASSAMSKLGDHLGDLVGARIKKKLGHVDTEEGKDKDNKKPESKDETGK